MENKDLQVELFRTVDVDRLEERREFGYSFLYYLLQASWYIKI